MQTRANIIDKFKDTASDLKNTITGDGDKKDEDKHDEDKSKYPPSGSEWISS